MSELTNGPLSSVEEITAVNEDITQLKVRALLSLLFSDISILFPKYSELFHTSFSFRRFWMIR